MKPIQIILLAAVALISVYFISRFRNKRVEVLMFCVMGLAAIVFILFPDYATRIANMLGVGRGTDLLLYVLVLVFWMIFLRLYVRIRELETTLTQLIRDQALEKAEKSGKEISGS